MSKCTRTIKLSHFLTLTVFCVVLSATSVHASINLPKLSIPDNTDYVFTPNFKIASTGQLKITVRIKTKVAGNAGYQIQLLRDRTVLKTRNVAAIPFYKTVELNYNVVDCAKVGIFKIRIKNLQTSNPKPGEADFPPFSPPSSDSCKNKKPRGSRKVSSAFGSVAANFFEQTVSMALSRVRLVQDRS